MKCFREAMEGDMFWYRYVFSIENPEVDIVSFIQLKLSRSRLYDSIKGPEIVFL
jgi:hypothetical protein